MKKVKLFEQFLNESISQADFDKLVKDLAYSMPNHTKYDDEVGPSEEQIMAAMKKYQKGLYKYTNDAQKKEAVKKVLQILTESTTTLPGTFEIGDSFEYIPNKGSIYTITKKMAFGQRWVITGDKNPNNKFILNNAEINQWIKDGKLVPVEESLDEATTSWAKMMKGVRAGESGPWSLVAIENNKVVAQKIDIRDKNLLPAHFEALRKEWPKAKIHIEDGGGQVVWNEELEIMEGTFNVWKTRDGLGINNVTAKKINSDIKKLIKAKNMIAGKDGNILTDLDGNVLFFENPALGQEVADELGASVTSKIETKDGKSNSASSRGGYMVVFESVINEAKELSREEMMDILKNKYKFPFVKTTEEFDGSEGGIWTAGESSPLLGGKKIYNYYGQGAAYELGVLKKFEQAIDKLGWYSEWYDAGTVMIWPN